MDVVKGVLRLNTPIVFYDKDKKNMSLGKVISIEANHKPLQQARKSDGKLLFDIFHIHYLNKF